MKRLSSSATLLLKLFLPVFWTVFFGSFVVALLLFDGYNPMINSIYFKTGIILFYFSGLLIIYFTFWKLRRVEVDSDYFYVTDYFKTVRIPFPLVRKITELNFVLFSTMTIHLKQKGYFGKKITLIQSKQKVDDFLRARTDLHLFFDGSTESENTDGSS